MNTNKNNNIPSPRFTLLALFLVLGVFVGILSCDNLDDTPPPSAYVPPTPEPEPEPGEPCKFETIVPELADGIDFECGGPEVSYFGEKEGTSFTLEFVENPDSSGINTSEKVVEYSQSEGVEPWAGFFFNLASKIDFSVLQTIKVKVYSPAADQIVLLKLEDAADGSIAKEVQAITTVANQWEELSFAFSPSDTGKFDNMVLFFDFNGKKDAPSTHYFDDIVMAAGGATEEPPTDSSEPSTAAPAPTVDPLGVISLFSGAYTNVAVDTWRTDWSDATLEEVAIDGDDVKKYSALGFVGVETVGNQIDATDMTHFHTDIWTGDATAFNIKLVDFGADGSFGGGDDTEHEIVIDNPNQQEWVSLDIPLSDFTGLTTRGHIGQLIYSAAPFKQATVYVDNVYFYDEAGVSTQPIVAAPVPSHAESNVISLFSDAYTNVAVDTWRTDWSAATLEEVSIAGNAVKKYSGLNFVGIETTSNQIDATDMTHFHTDVWTADATQIRIKLVDFGADGAFGGDDDVEHELTIANPEQHKWISLDIPLADFTGLTTRANIAQLIYAGQPAGSMTLFVDNVYFHK